MLPPSLVALTPGDLRGAEVDEFVARVNAAFAAGLRGLLLREPTLCDRDFLRLAALLAKIARANSAWFCVHDRVHVALEVCADAVHLGFRSLSPPVARRLLTQGMALGISTHQGDTPESYAGCDYRIHGPVFDTPSKQGLKEAIGMAGLDLAARASTLPLWAIGGLRPEHATALRSHGAQGAIARASIFNARESALQCAARVRAWLAVMPDASADLRSAKP